MNSRALATTSASLLFMLPLASSASTIDTGSTASWNSSTFWTTPFSTTSRSAAGEIEILTRVVGRGEFDDRPDRRRFAREVARTRPDDMRRICPS